MSEIEKRPEFHFDSKANNEELSIIKSAFNEVYRLLKKNLKKPFLLVKTRCAYPGGKFKGAYIWDSAFISNIWRIWDNDIAKEIMMPFLDHQLENGMCPKDIGLRFKLNKKQTNPPLIAWALTENARMTGDYEELKELYPKLQKFNEFLYRKRERDGLFIWKHSYESGIDNSPRFTDITEKEEYDIQNFWAIDFSSWMVLHNQRMAEIAENLNLGDDAKEYKSKADLLIKNINKHLWDESIGYYFDYDLKHERFIDIPTIASFFPLYVNAPDENKAKKLIEHLKNPDEFNTLVPFPTVAHNHPTFVKDMWRGPNWINTSYIVIKGLQNYGEEEFAADCAYRTVKGVAMTHHNLGSIYEFYDPDNYHQEELSRKKGNLYKQITLGSKPVGNFTGWSGLVNTLFVEIILGYKRLNGKTTVTPKLPPEWTNVDISFSLPQYNQLVSVSIDQNQTIKTNIKSLSK